MASRKKKEELSLEEKLEQALVPVEEWPYEVPGNWCWIHLLDTFDNVTDSKKKLATKEYLEEGKYPIVDQGQEFIGGYTNNEDIVYEGELPIIIFGDHTRCVKYIDFVFAQGADGVKVLKPKSFWNAKAFYYGFQSIEIPNLGYRRHYPLFKNICIPIPPLNEQQRIVDRIEGLFAKLDEVKEKVQVVIDGFELRKTVILHKAFTGELTERWRKEHGVGLDSWKKCLIGEVFVLQAGKNISAKEISNQQSDLYRYPCFGGNGVRGYVDRFNCEGEHPIIGRQGALCGNVNLANDRFYATEHAVVVSYKMKVSTSWAYYYLKFLNLNQYATATAQPGLAVSNIVKVPIQYVPFEEQTEISRILDDFLCKEQQAKEAAKAVLVQIDTMKRAILARAFRGELGTNDPAEESAVELVKFAVGE